jgi:hypothetical protein
VKVANFVEAKAIAYLLAARDARGCRKNKPVSHLRL